MNGFERYAKKDTTASVFLEEMEHVVPWRGVVLAN